jgi:hypothetical protein
MLRVIIPSVPLSSLEQAHRVTYTVRIQSREIRVTSAVLRSAQVIGSGSTIPSLTPPPPGRASFARRKASGFPLRFENGLAQTDTATNCSQPRYTGQPPRLAATAIQTLLADHVEQRRRRMIPPAFAFRRGHRDRPCVPTSRFPSGCAANPPGSASSARPTVRCAT